MILALLPLALSAPVEVHVGGVGAARSVVVLVRGVGGPLAAACNDAALAPDLAADGRWTCTAVEVEQEAFAAALLVDGALSDLGVLQRPTSGVLGIQRNPEGVQAAAGEAHLVPGPSGGGGAQTVLARVVGYTGAAAPVLQLLGPGGAVDLWCRDDGNFPDRVVNDQEPGCAGVTAPGDTQVALRGGDGAQVTLGTLRLDPSPLHFLTLDLAAGKVDTTPFALSIWAAAPAAEAVPELAPEGAASAPGAAPEEAPLWPLWLTLGLLAGGAGGVLLARRRPASALHPSLQRAPNTPLLPGGPALSDPGAVLRHAAPAELVADLARRIGARRRLLLVGAELPPVDADAWTCAARDWNEVVAAARSLAAEPGPPVALLVLGADTLSDPGAVVPDPIGELVKALPPGAWLGVFIAPGQRLKAWLPAFDVAADGSCTAAI